MEQQRSTCPTVGTAISYLPNRKGNPERDRIFKVCPRIALGYFKHEPAERSKTVFNQVIKTMKEYRLTRNEPYLNPNCFGHTDLEVQSSYYIKAECEEEAIARPRCFPATVLDSLLNSGNPTQAQKTWSQITMTHYHNGDYYANESDYWVAEYPEVINPQFLINYRHRLVKSHLRGCVAPRCHHRQPLHQCRVLEILVWNS